MFIKPSRQQRDLSRELKTAGTFYCLLTGIDEISPDPQYPKSKNRLVFEFTVVDRKVPHLNGQKGCTIVTASIFKDRSSGRESNLLKLARSMGVVNPEKGFDPDMLLDKYYFVNFQLHEGKAYAQTVMPAPAPGESGQPNGEPVKYDHADPGREDTGTVPF